MSDDLAAAIERLEAFWDLPDGVLYRLRQGEYDPKGIDEVVQMLESLTVDEEAALPRRFVSLTWYLPSFMEWQVERVQERGGDVEGLKRDTVRVHNALDELLGVP